MTLLLLIGQMLLAVPFIPNATETELEVRIWQGSCNLDARYCRPDMTRRVVETLRLPLSAFVCGPAPPGVRYLALPIDGVAGQTIGYRAEVAGSECVAPVTVTTQTLDGEVDARFLAGATLGTYSQVMPVRVKAPVAP